MPSLATRTIQLKSIRYLGPSVGREWSFRFTVGGRVTEVVSRLEPETSRRYTRALGREHLDAPDGLKVKIEAREVDTRPELDDVGCVVATLDGEESRHVVRLSVPTRGSELADETELEFTFGVTSDDNAGLEGKLETSSPRRRNGDVYWTGPGT